MKSIVECIGKHLHKNEPIAVLEFSNDG